MHSLNLSAYNQRESVIARGLHREVPQPSEPEPEYCWKCRVEITDENRGAYGDECKSCSAEILKMAGREEM